MNKDNVETLIELMRTHEDPDVRAFVMEKIVERYDTPHKWIEEGLKDPDAEVRIEAANIFRTHEIIPLDFYELALQDDEWIVRYRAVKAFDKRDDIPFSMMIQMLSDPDNSVRRAAVEAFRGRGDVPIELTKLMLDHCENDVVRAEAFDILLDIYLKEEGDALFADNTKYPIDDKIEEN